MKYVYVYLVVSVTNPMREWSEGVDMDFLRVSWAPGSLGGRVGQGVRGTYPEDSEAGYSGQDPSPTTPRLLNPPNRFFIVAPEQIKSHHLEQMRVGQLSYDDFESFHKMLVKLFFYYKQVQDELMKYSCFCYVVTV